jgi:hypothetical protein
MTAVPAVPDNARLGIAYARAFIADDLHGMAVTEKHCDPGDMISSLLGLAVALGLIAYGSRAELDEHLAQWLE